MTALRKTTENTVRHGVRKSSCSMCTSMRNQALVWFYQFFIWQYKLFPRTPCRLAKLCSVSKLVQFVPAKVSNAISTTRHWPNLCCLGALNGKKPSVVPHHLRWDAKSYAFTGTEWHASQWLPCLIPLGLHLDIATKFAQLLLEVFQVFRSTPCVHHLKAVLKR